MLNGQETPESEVSARELFQSPQGFSPGLGPLWLQSPGQSGLRHSASWGHHLANAHLAPIGPQSSQAQALYTMDAFA